MTTVEPELQTDQSFIDKLKTGWMTLPKSRKIIVGILFSGVILGMIFYGVSASKQAYSTLYTDLDIETAGQIKTSLEESGITDYKIGEGGTSILVPVELVDQLRMDLAVSGITPQTETGFEIFDNSQLGMTEQEHDIMFQRGLEGELQRSIISLDAVEEARVHLNISEDTIFSRETDPSTASVILALKSGKSLSAEQVDGIVALVSGAVNNLSPENVEVIDTKGNLLTRHQSEGGYYQTGEIVSKEIEYELHLEDKLQAQLGKVFGHDKIAVSVRVSLDLDSEEEKTEEYTDGALLSQDTTFDREDGDVQTDDEDGGPLDNNIQNSLEDGVEGALADPSITDFSQSNNYQPSVNQTHTIKPPGEIKNVSVSVIYSGEIDENMSLVMEDHVESIVGVDEDRGDKVSIAGIPFELPILDTTEGGDSNTTIVFTKETAFLSAIGLGILILLVLILLMMFKKRKRVEEVLYEDEFENVISDVYNEHKHIIESEERNVPTQLDQIRDMFKADSMTSTELLKIWLNDEKTEDSLETISDELLTGVEKVACLLIILGKDITADVIKHLPQEHVAYLIQTIASIRIVPKKRAVSIMDEYFKLYEAYRYLAQGGYEFAKETLTRAFGVKGAEELLDKIKDTIQTKKPFSSLQHMTTQQLVATLTDEHPQTIALILCYLPTEKAAKIISELPDDIQADVTQRIGLMSNTSSQIIEAVEDVIESRISSIGTSNVAQIGGLTTVVDILNSVDRSTQSNILRQMQTANEEFAEEVKNNLFTFEDITNLDNVTIQRIIREVDQPTLALALKGTSDYVTELIMKNISQRAAERLQEEIMYLGPVRLVEVEKAQQKIVSAIRTLEENGEIVINTGGDNDVIY